jgi:hypothetical protein
VGRTHDTRHDREHEHPGGGPGHLQGEARPDCARGDDQDPGDERRPERRERHGCPLRDDEGSFTAAAGSSSCPERKLRRGNETGGDERRPDVGDISPQSEEERVLRPEADDRGDHDRGPASGDPERREQPRRRAENRDEGRLSITGRGGIEDEAGEQDERGCGRR